MRELFIGLISGTSMDGVDAAILEFADGQPKQLIAQLGKSYPSHLLTPLRSLAKDVEIPMDMLGSADRQLGDFLAETTLELLQTAGLEPSKISAIGSHGQTIRHQPAGQNPYTLQIGDPNRIADQTGITTVADFRRRDMAAGGEAAPLVPAFHNAVFRNADESRVVVNIGGIANITCLPLDPTAPVTGFDCGPGNTLMDATVREAFSKPYDINGEIASSGVIDKDLLARMLEDPYFEMAAPKSTGPEYFSKSWLDQALTAHGKELSTPDLLATLAELTAITIHQAIENSNLDIGRLLVCGGGAHNAHLMQRLAQNMHCTVETTTEYGFGADWVEAAAFAWLARQTLNHLPGNIPAVTGANKEVILGAIYPA